ncbi:MAG: glyoxalase [Gammaproteobacteria bacterium]|nr:glyoxalase [Gammaproteobacteria bacterium]MBJ54985.1 glyoxalase [Gammaproteobacteria bacterium]|tara:strand:+ start:17 stop:400 length:384 start_codon:yes stop_codon:yes gene_type:complete
MQIVGLDHVQLAMPRGKEAQARAFYCDVLGMSEVPKPATLASRGGVWFERGVVKIHLGVEDEFRAARKAHPALVVTELGELIRTLAANGYEVLEDTGIPGVCRAFSHDPFGNRIEFIQDVTASGHNN